MRASLLPLLAVLVALPLALASRTADSAAQSPHGSSTACDTCHDKAADGASVSALTWKTGTPNGACAQCHTHDHHQPDLVPVRTTTPDGWPMNGQRLACFTCHDEPACDGKALDPANPQMLRGGPYPVVGQICSTCHGGTRRAGFSPHKAADPVKDRAVCNHCHQSTPDPTRPVGELKLVSRKICLGCHKSDEHEGSAVHLVALPAAIQESARAGRLPLLEDGSMGCITCHDPHPPGVVPHTADRAQRLGQAVVPDRWIRTTLQPAAKADQGFPMPSVREPDYLWLPIRDGTLCTTCHLPGRIGK